MKKFSKSFLLMMPLIAMACNDDDMDMQSELNVNFPAAYVVNGESNSISVINLSTAEVAGTIKLSDGSMGGSMNDMIMWPHHVYMNSSKTQVAIGVPGMDLSAGHSGGMAGMEGKVAVVDAVKGTVLKVVHLDMMNHNAVFSPDEKEIWTSQMGEMGSVLVYDASTYALKSTIPVGSDPAEVTFSFDGSVAFVANGSSNTVTAINPATKEVLKTIDVGADPVGAWPGSDNKMYVDNEVGQTISIINVSTLEIESTIELGFMPGMAAYTDMGKELWVSDPVNGKVHYWIYQSNTWNHGGVFSTGAGAHAIAFDEDSMKAYVTNQGAESVSVINAMNHTVSKTLTVGKKPNGIVIKK